MGSLHCGHSGMQAPSSLVSSDGASALTWDIGKRMKATYGRSYGPGPVVPVTSLLSIGQSHPTARDDEEWSLALCPGKGKMVSTKYRALSSERPYSWVCCSSFALLKPSLFKGREVENTPFHIWQSISLTLPFENWKLMLQFFCLIKIMSSLSNKLFCMFAISCFLSNYLLSLSLKTLKHFTLVKFDKFWLTKMVFSYYST